MPELSCCSMFFSQKRMASSTHPSATVPVPIPKPWLNPSYTWNTAVDRLGEDLSGEAGAEVVYDLSGRQVPADSADHGVYIVRRGEKAVRILR